MATKKWQESDFCKMSPVHSAETLQVQNFVKIALPRTVSKINALVNFTQKFKMVTKSGAKVDSLYTLWAKNFVEIALSSTVSKISVFMFHTEIQDGCQKWQESDFCEKLPVHWTPWGLKNFDEITLSHTVKEIEVNLCFCIFRNNSKI